MLHNRRHKTRVFRNPPELSARPDMSLCKYDPRPRPKAARNAYCFGLNSPSQSLHGLDILRVDALQSLFLNLIHLVERIVLVASGNGDFLAAFHRDSNRSRQG